MLYLGDKAESPEDGRALAEEALASGAAWRKFREMVEAQGGDLDYVNEPERLPRAELVWEVTAPRAGYVASMQTDAIGMAVVALGGGREEKGAPIDHAVGLVMGCDVGDRVEEGDVLFTVHADSREKGEEAEERVLDAIAISDEPVEPLPLFYDRIS
jgi:pyrimidine-nucleoside phosphorylase